MTNIRTQPSPLLIGQPTVNLDENSFNAAVWNKGYKVVHEEARQCPCRSRDSGSPLVTCQNCRGFGQIFINPVKTRALISNINQNPKFMEWSAENTGTIMASLMNANKLADYDRITFVEAVSKWSETLRVREVDGQLFVFLTYKPQEILDIFYFESSALPLVKLDTTDYSISADNEYVILLDFVPIVGWNNTVTVTYLCTPSYHIIDLPHDLRASTIMNQLGQREKIDLPVNAVLRKAHIVLGLSDYEGGIVTINNSYK